MVDPNSRRAFSTIVAAACIDGDLSNPEREVLHRKATEYDIPVGLMRELIDLGVQGKLAVAVPPSREDRESLLDDLIDVACADGRIEGPEHHLLAKFASHLGLQLSDLRARVRQRLQTKPSPKPAAPPREEPRTAVRPAPPVVKETRRPEPPRPAPAADRPVAPPTPPMKDPPPFVPGPVTLAGPALEGPSVDALPPVTLQLIKQSILFELPADALRYIERTLGVTKEEADEVRRKILQAFPDLKPGAQQLRGSIPKKS